MKIFVILMTLLFTFQGKAQTVYESLISVEKSYAPLFGDAASLAIALLMKYDLDSPDTSFQVVVKVDQIRAETVGYSLGASLFSGNLLSGIAGNYVYRKETGGIVLGYEEFMDFYRGVNRVFTFITTTKNMKGSRRNSLITYQSKDVIFGGEYNPKLIESSKVQYYFQVGEAAFRISEDEFEIIAARVRNMKDAWDSFNK